MCIYICIYVCKLHLYVTVIHPLNTLSGTQTAVDIRTDNV